MSLVIDASVTLAWVFEDEVTPLTEAALDEVVRKGGRAPGLWTLEVLNVLVVAERRGRITAAQGSRFADRLFSLPIAVENTLKPTERTEVLGMARTHRLSAYDATYLELAVRTDSPLATRDDLLADAARTVGVEVFGDPERR